MGNRNLRVNELLKREVSEYVHRHLQAEAVGVTIADVEATNDYKTATVYFSLLTRQGSGADMETMLNRHAQAINQHLRRVITLRNIPRIVFKYDTSLERGDRVLRLLDDIDADQKRRAP